MSSLNERCQRRRARGYTLVELMMALALFTVAMLGVISMQKITSATNAHAKNVAMAQRIAQAWAGQLELDATAWQTGFGTGWLNSSNQWQRPPYSATRLFGPAFDYKGGPLDDSKVADAAFCTHVRMAWLYPPGMGVGNNGMLRAEIRVFWLREGEVPLDSLASICGAAQSATQANDIGLATDRYRFVYQTVGIRQHPRT